MKSITNLLLIMTLVTVVSTDALAMISSEEDGNDDGLGEEIDPELEELQSAFTRLEVAAPAALDVDTAPCLILMLPRDLIATSIAQYLDLKAIRSFACTCQRIKQFLKLPFRRLLQQVRTSLIQQFSHHQPRGLHPRYSQNLFAIFLYAVKNNDVPTVECILEIEPNFVIALEEYGSTALHKAVYHGHLAMVLCLCEHGADPNTRDKRGRTALKLAKIYGKNDIIDFLKPARQGLFSKVLV